MIYSVSLKDANCASSVSALLVSAGFAEFKNQVTSYETCGKSQTDITSPPSFTSSVPSNQLGFKGQIPRSDTASRSDLLPPSASPSSHPLPPSQFTLSPSLTKSSVILPSPPPPSQFTFSPSLTISSGICPSPRSESTNFTQ